MSVWAVIGAVALASLLGSLHCAGMCGAFVAIAVGNVSGARGWRSGAVTQSAYHIGRLVSYATIGALAGAMGGLVNIASTLNGMRPVAASLAGATIVAFGVVTLLRLSGSRIAGLKVPRAWVNVVARISRTAMDRPPAARALMIGLCTTLLPCGWLYAFVITAAGTGSAATGALVMASFSL